MDSLGYLVVMFLFFSICISVSPTVLMRSVCSLLPWQVLENEKSVEKLKEVISMNASEFSKVRLPTLPAGVSVETQLHGAVVT